MLGQILRFLVEIVFTIMGAALLVRAWMFAVRMPAFNPLAHAVFRCTDWLVAPLRRIFPHRGKVEWSCLVAAWLAAIVYLLLLWFIYTGSLVILTRPELLLSLAVQSLITVAKWALNLVVWLTLIQAILSWVNPAAPMMPVLQMLTAPLLNPVRRLMPNSSIDFSPLIVLVVAQILMMLLANVGFSMFGM